MIGSLIFGGVHTWGAEIRDTCFAFRSLSDDCNSMQSVLSGRSHSLLRTARAAPGRLRRVRRNWSDVKRMTWCREHSALSNNVCAHATERKQFMANMVQLAKPVRSMGTLCLPHLLKGTNSHVLNLSWPIIAWRRSSELVYTRKDCIAEIKSCAGW